MSRLGDLVIEAGPYETRLDHMRGFGGGLTADDLNALRDELIELRRIAASVPSGSRVRVYAVANLHKGRIHGITCNVNQSAAWVRVLCDQYGPDAAVQCVDVVDPAQQTIAWDRGDRALRDTGSKPIE